MNNMEQPVEVLVFGSAMIDLTTYTRNMPKIGETIHGTYFQKSFGGKGANQAVQCGRLGVKTAFIGMVGEDTHGCEYVDNLSIENIDTSYVSRSTIHTGIASIWVDESGKNSIVIVPGANLCLSVIPLQEFMQSNRAINTKVVVFQNEVNEVVNLQSLKWIRENFPKMVSIFNPAPATEGCRDMAKLCDILCLNEVELSFLSDLPTKTDEEVKVAALTLLEIGCKAVVVTLGDRGAALLLPDRNRLSVLFRLFPTKHVKAVDSVGAGDSFLGCFAANVARGVALETSIERAVSCATLSVLSKGAQPSYKYLRDIPVADQVPSMCMGGLNVEALFQPK